MQTTYNLNGNIETMWRKGSIAENSQMVATAFGVIDNMTYDYASNSNTLRKVSDTGLNTDGFKDGTNTGNDYTYDDNGNLIADANKDITSITYNHLNLPQEIQFTNNRKIVFVYDAAGVKLKKEHYNNSTTPTIVKDYVGGIEYNNNTIEAIYTDEGRAVPTGTGYRYEYTLKDHLGNSRVMFSDVNNDGQVDENEIIQEEHYYPFGLRHEGYGRTITHGENDYQYNGKELNTDFGLDWYSYGFRMYDASIGRFPSCDPIAEEFAFVSPYNYAENRVPNAIDLWGLQAYVVTENYDENNQLTSMRVQTHTNDDGTLVYDNGKTELSDGTPMGTVLVNKNYYDAEGKIRKTDEKTRGDLSTAQKYAYENGTKTQYPSDGFDTSDGFKKLENSTLRESTGSFISIGFSITSPNGKVNMDNIIGTLQTRIGDTDDVAMIFLTYSNETQNKEEKKSDVNKLKTAFPERKGGWVKVNSNFFDSSFNGNGPRQWNGEDNAKNVRLLIFNRNKNKDRA